MTQLQALPKIFLFYFLFFLSVITRLLFSNTYPYNKYAGSSVPFTDILLQTY